MKEGLQKSLLWSQRDVLGFHDVNVLSWVWTLFCVVSACSPCVWMGFFLLLKKLGFTGK